MQYEYRSRCPGLSSALDIGEERFRSLFDPKVKTPPSRKQRERVGHPVTTYCTVNTAEPVVPPALAPIVVWPAALQVARPPTLGAFAIVATLAEDELQWLFSVRSCVLLSLKVPVAANCCVLPALHVGVAGVTASETSVPVPTVSVVVPLTPDEEAVMVTLPLFLPWAMPVCRIETRFGFDDLHDTLLRLVAVLPSLKVPVAVNFTDVPFSMREFAGVIEIDTRRSGDTVSVVEPLTEPKAACRVVVPLATLEARPWALMVATEADEEDQKTDPVMSCVLESLKVPIAANWRVVSGAMVEFAGVTAIETSVAALTVSDPVPLTLPEVAVMVAVPVPTPDATPFASMLATPVAEDDQVTFCNNCVLPSSKVPVAVNCCVVPATID